MIMIPPSVRVYLAVGATDMRKSFDGLSGQARSVFGADPMSGHLFVFTNGRRNRLKILYWDSSGFCVLHKRLERGTFAWPAAESSETGKVELDSRELALLLSGLDLTATRQRKWMNMRPAI